MKCFLTNEFLFYGMDFKIYVLIDRNLRVATPRKEL